MQSNTTCNTPLPLCSGKNFFKILLLSLCLIGFSTVCFSQSSISSPASTDDQIKAKADKIEITSKGEIENTDVKIESLVSRSLRLQEKISIVCKAKENKDVYSNLQIKYSDKLSSSCPSFPRENFGKADASFLKKWAAQNPAEVSNYNIILEKVLTDTIQ
jgi:hypothetical protein